MTIPIRPNASPALAPLAARRTGGPARSPDDIRTVSAGVMSGHRTPGHATIRKDDTPAGIVVPHHRFPVVPASARYDRRAREIGERAPLHRTTLR